MFNRKKTSYFYLLINLAFFTGIYSQSINDLQKLKSEYERLSSEQRKEQSLNTINDIEDLIQLPQAAQISPFRLSKKDSSEIKSNFFGYNYFTQRDTIAFWENLPTPINYLLGPGDELVITLWGETQLRNTYTISREGNIYDSKVGLLNLMGKSIEESKKYLINQYGRVYATLNSSNPSTYLDISLGQLRSINVNFVGEVKYPGVYPIHPFSTVITGLIQSGGVDTTGSLRKIKVVRDNKAYVIIDFYDYLIEGKLPSKNIQLRDNDVVVVPVRESTVRIDSSVIRPGVYESLPGENIKQMIYYAGGLSNNASSVISLKRIVPIEERIQTELGILNYYIDYNNSESNAVQNGDKIIVQKMFDVISQVEIIGQVKNQGFYNYYEGMKLRDLFILGSGYNDTTFWKSVYQNRGELVRRNPNTRYETVIEINLRDLANGYDKVNIELQNLDRFVVHANPNYFEKTNVQVIGEVNIPGAYPLIQDNETLESILNRSGGLTPKALSDGISIYRDKKYFRENLSIIKSQERINEENAHQNDKVRLAWQNQEIVLMPGDSIVVSESTGTINIFGEIYNPGLIEYRMGKSLNYYINAAGGITDKGNKNGIIVIYSNGLVSPKRWYSYPKIRDGSTIIVTKKEFTQPFDLTQFATNWTTILSSLIASIVLSRQISS